MNNKEENINAAMNSLDGIQRATPGPFFFTRVNARQERMQKSPWQVMARTITRPAVIISGLCLVLLINVWVIVTRSEGVSSNQQNSELVLADEYAATSSSLYYYDK